MCGILVIDSNTAPNIKKHSISIIKQRGPDQLSTLEYDGYLFCHSRLIISGDIANGQQPMSNNKYIFLFNGEIYNTHYLSAIVNPLENFKSDTQLIFEGFLKYGIAFFNACDGPFAIVIYDKENKSFTCLRDHLGEKPLFVTTHLSKKIISSDLRVFSIFKSVEKTAFINIVSKGYCSRQDTLYHDVKRVNPLIPKGEFYDSYLAFVRSICFFDLRDTLSLISKNIFYPNSCLLLSGGVDSTLVAALLKDHGTVNTYTLSDLSSQLTDESCSAIRNSKKLKLPHALLKIHDVYEFDNVMATLADMSEPIGDPGIFNQHMCIKLLKNNYKVVFVGTAADEIFAGYERYKFLLIILIISYLPLRIRLLLRKLLFFFFKSSEIRERINKLLSFSNISSIEQDRQSFLPNQLFASFDSITFINGMEARTPFTSIALRPFWVTTCLTHTFSFLFLKHRLKIMLLAYKINLFAKTKKGFTNEYSKIISKPYFRVRNYFNIPIQSELQLVRLFILEKWLELNSPLFANSHTDDY